MKPAAHPTRTHSTPFNALPLPLAQVASVDAELVADCARYGLEVSGVLPVAGEPQTDLPGRRIGVGALVEHGDHGPAAGVRLPLLSDQVEAAGCPLGGRRILELHLRHERISLISIPASRARSTQPAVPWLSCGLGLSQCSRVHGPMKASRSAAPAFTMRSLRSGPALFPGPSRRP